MTLCAHAFASIYRTMASGICPRRTQGGPSENESNAAAAGAGVNRRLRDRGTAARGARAVPADRRDRQAAFPVGAEGMRDQRRATLGAVAHPGRARPQSRRSFTADVVAPVDREQPGGPPGTARTRAPRTRPAGPARREVVLHDGRTR